MPRSSAVAWQKDYAEFLKRLVAARTAAGFSQREVAARLGRSQSWVAQRETGEVRVDIVELAHFAGLYRKSLNFFAPFLRDFKDL